MTGGCVVRPHVVEADSEVDALHLLQHAQRDQPAQRHVVLDQRGRLRSTRTAERQTRTVGECRMGKGGSKE
eukprot:5230006-Pleurochrysis_carterae.AAC.1